MSISYYEMSQQRFRVKLLLGEIFYPGQLYKMSEQSNYMVEYAWVI